MECSEGGHGRNAVNSSFGEKVGKGLGGDGVPDGAFKEIEEDRSGKPRRGPLR